MRTKKVRTQEEGYCNVSLTEIWEFKIHQHRHDYNQWIEQPNQNCKKVEIEVCDTVDAINIKMEKEENYPHADINNDTKVQRIPIGK